MAIPVRCESCGREFEVDDHLASQRVKCPCGQVLQVGNASPTMDFFSEELNVNVDPLSAQTPDDWAKATGASPEIAEQLHRKMAKKRTSSAGFMMAVTGAVIALMLLIGLIAYLLAPN